MTALPSRWARPARTSRLLTDEERRYRDLKEAAFQVQVTDLAVIFGWTWCHWRPLRNSRGIWQVPVEGPLGKGWPDLTLVRARDRRMIFAELKREAKDPEPDQVAVLETLSSLRRGVEELIELGSTSVEVYLWRPSDLSDPAQDSTIGRILR